MSSAFRQYQSQIPRTDNLLPVQGNASHLWVGSSGKKLGYTPNPKEVADKGYTTYNPTGLNRTRHVQPLNQVGNLLGTGATILGSASLAAPALAPVAAGLGVGYGLYKLGENFKLW
jgi:hypothetical protein